MCGIAGYYTAGRSVALEGGLKPLKNMTDTMKLRGPDIGGYWCDTEKGIYLGHRRLSIIDLSDAGNQPMISQCGRYVMVFNGEIYNFNKLSIELKKIEAQISFKGHSDTEILLECFARIGFKKTLNLIKGMFTIALWDNKEEQLFLVRDHVGKKPLYFGIVKDKIVFASELKAIKNISGNDLKINNKALNLYNYFGFIPSPYSIYSDIYKLPPSNYIIIGKNDILDRDSKNLIEKAKQYWQFTKNDNQLSEKCWRRELHSILKESVSQRMISDAPLGAFLSGGIDSSLISALMQENSNSAINTYSIGFLNSEFDESRHAEKVAKHLGTNHTTYVIEAQDTQKIIPDLHKIYDEPFADYSQIPTSILCQQAKIDTTVALSGDGGDEVFCGYKRYFMLKKLWDYSNVMPLALRKKISALLLLASQGTYNKLGVNGKRIHSIAGFLTEESIKSAAFRAFSVNPYVDFSDNLYIGDLTNLDNLEKMMMIDSNLYLPDDILVKVDRASMFSSLEVRSPLLDKDVIEFAWQIPIKDKIFAKKGKGKKPLYDLLCKYVPEEIINRPKQGFTPPIASWLRGDLRDWAQDILYTDTPLYEKSYKDKCWNEFIIGYKDNHHIIWSILMAQSWYLNSKY